ncbi:phosphatase PAP2 family protein [Sunxiuqinia sp. A32]|uniref:phosphatase PAP2 family protein n=1 Tax=Sunxiuqinia sp. A32 TaxID=3461496 RepID=UPI004045D78C
MELNDQHRSILKNKGLLGFLAMYSLFFLVGAVLLIILKHGDVVLWLNRYSKEELDGFVNILTDLGLGSFIVVVMVLLSFIRVRYALMGLVNLAFVGIFTNLFKKVLFPDRIRPLNYFLYDDFHRFLYQAELNYHSSFPSGHTMTIFAAMSLIAYFVGNRIVGGLMFFVALVIGFTRIYLLQHFFLDVFVGSVLGIISTLLVIWIADCKLDLHQNQIFQKPIFQISFKKNK